MTFKGRCPACWCEAMMTLQPINPSDVGRTWAGKCIHGHDIRLEASKAGVPAEKLIREVGPSPSIRKTRLAR
jgi:hypothetical protein